MLTEINTITKCWSNVFNTSGRTEKSMITLVVSIVLTLIFVRVIYLIVLRFVSLRKTVLVFFYF